MMRAPATPLLGALAGLVLLPVRPAAAIHETAANHSNTNKTVPTIMIYNDIPLPYASSLNLDANMQVLSRGNRKFLDRVTSECFLAYHRVFEQLRQRDLNDANATHVDDLPECFFDLIRTLLSSPLNTTNTTSSSSSSIVSSPLELQQSQPQPQQPQDAKKIPTISNEDIAAIITARPGEMNIRGHVPPPLRRKLRRKLRRGRGHGSLGGGSSEVLLQNANHSTSLQQRRQLGDMDQCYASIINVVVETISLILCMFGFAGVGRAVGRSVVKKLSSNAKNDIKDFVGTMPTSGGNGASASGLAEVFLVSVGNIGFTSFMDSIFNNVAWWEWAIVALVLAAELTLLIASGGASIALKVVLKTINIGLFGNAVFQAQQNCEGVGRIGCYSFPGMDFYEGFKMEGGFPCIGAGCDFEELVMEECVDSGACKAVSTQNWMWIGSIRPYDEWQPKEGRCKGLAVKRNLNFCRNDIDGYMFYDLFDSPEYTIGSYPFVHLKDLADLCNNLGDSCQGFNAQGDLKSVIQTTPYWTRPTKKCQGLYVKKAVNVCPVAPGFVFYESRVSIGNELVDLKNDGGLIGDILDACNQEGEACQGFSTFGSLQSSISSIHSWERTDLLCYGMYVRETIPVDCGGLPGYLFVPNRDQRWNDITRRHLYSNNELANSCTANPTCEGFNTNYYLKHQIDEPIFWKSTPGLCEGLFIRNEVQFPTVFCEDRISINTRFTKTKTCTGPLFGQTRFIFQTHDTAGQGFDDDEYVIRVFQGGTEVWTSTERGRAGTGSSGDNLLGTANGGIWKVQFDCTLDSIWNKCENGDFEFRLVDCGCVGGTAPLLECDIQTINRARNAFCPATPAPTPEPTPVPTTLAPSESPTHFPTPTPRPTRAVAEEENFGCFSGEVLVDVKDVGSIPLKELKVGDKVLALNGIYEPVYSFGHIRRDQWLRYIRIHAEGLHAPLELSKDHLVYVTTYGKEYSTPVRAASVQVGNLLVIMDPTTTTTTNTSRTISSRVYHVDTVMREGLFAPFTKAGVISVNGALASQYVTGQPAVNNLHVGDFDTGITWHWLVHAFQAGPRLYYRFFGINHGREADTSDGSTVLSESEFPGVYMQSFSQMRWILVEQHPLAQYILLPMFMMPTMAVSSFFYAVELVLDSLLTGHCSESVPEHSCAEQAVWTSTTTSYKDTI